MTFDKSKVYTAVNADELKVGSKVVVGDSLLALKIKVRRGEYQFIESIRDESAACRFKVKDSGKYIFNLAYLIEEPQEQGLKCTDIKLGEMRYCADVNFFYEVKFKSLIGFSVSQETINEAIEFAIEEMRG